MIEVSGWMGWVGVGGGMGGQWSQSQVIPSIRTQTAVPGLQHVSDRNRLNPKDRVKQSLALV